MKKNITKKPPINKKSATSTKKVKSNFKPLALSNILVAITISFIIAIGYFYMQDQNLQPIDKQEQQNIIVAQKIQQNINEEQDSKYFEEKTKALEIEYVSNIDTNTYVEKKEVNIYINPYGTSKQTIKKKKEIIKKEKVKVQKKIIKKAKVKKEKVKKKIIKKIKTKDSYLPKLAIIIDDVTAKSQIKKILNIGYTVNMAFLPPTNRHKSSAKVTKELNTYMIHLPLQASSSRYEEADTLHIDDSLKKIDNRIKKLKKLYPKAKFLNNHTGSKFTANKEAMDKLLQILRKYNYTFIDSRTTSKSVAKKSAKKYGVRILSRNIFLDNKKDKKYIQKQLKRAVKIAKKNGSAIAIGHPYNITFSTLKESKHLLKGLDLVFVNKL
jgi:polysaccharide deacetylase 2 family uncharacterized protein YibQ